MEYEYTEPLISRRPSINFGITLEVKSDAGHKSMTQSFTRTGKNFKNNWISECRSKIVINCSKKFLFSFESLHS